jgi:hypothetical protein
VIKKTGLSHECPSGSAPEKSSLPKCYRGRLAQRKKLSKKRQVNLALLYLEKIAIISRSFKDLERILKGS